MRIEEEESSLRHPKTTARYLPKSRTIREEKAWTGGRPRRGVSHNGLEANRRKMDSSTYGKGVGQTGRFPVQNTIVRRRVGGGNSAPQGGKED